MEIEKSNKEPAAELTQQQGITMKLAAEFS